MTVEIVLKFLSPLAKYAGNFLSKAKQKKLIRTAIDSELLDLGGKLLLISCLIRNHNESFSVEYLNWFEANIIRFPQQVEAQLFIENIPFIKKVLSNQEKELGEHFRQQFSGKHWKLNRYNLPITEMYIRELINFPIDYQTVIRQIMEKISFFNQNADHLNAQPQKTFEKISTENRKIIKSNLDAGYVQLANICEQTVDLIIKSYSFPS